MPEVRALVVLAALAGAVAGGSPGRAAVVTHPDWVRLPNADELAFAYPELARLLAIEGKAGLRCDVTAAGDLDHCVALDETPKGLGFGAAALTLAHTFHMRPKMVDGWPVTGGVVTIPLRFTLHVEPPEIASKIEPRPAPAPFLLAMQAVDRSALPFMFAVVAHARIAQAAESSGVMVTPTVRAAAVSAFDDSVAAYMPTLRESLARLFAMRFSERELRDIIAFDAGPAVQYIETRRDRIGPESDRIFETATQVVVDDARARFCAIHDCKIAPLVFPPED
jgi:TonB family protein